MTSHPAQASAADTATADILIATPEAAEELCANMAETMEALIATIEEETALLRSGKLIAANDLNPAKSNLAKQYLDDVAAMRANTVALSRFAPDSVEALRHRHAEFRALLQINLAVLATAREVSQDLVHSVARKMNAGAAPQNYGRAGTIARPRQEMAQGLSIDSAI